MTTRRETERHLTPVASDYAADVVLGRNSEDRPAVNVRFTVDEDLVWTIGFTDPLVLRDIAGDLQLAAGYLEDLYFNSLYGDAEDESTP